MICLILVRNLVLGHVHGLGNGPRVRCTDSHRSLLLLSVVVTVIVPCVSRQLRACSSVCLRVQLPMATAGAPMPVGHPRHQLHHRWAMVTTVVGWPPLVAANQSPVGSFPGAGCNKNRSTKIM